LLRYQPFFAKNKKQMLQLGFDTDPTQLTQLLRRLDWIGLDESVIHLEKPGEGNMNMVLRVRTQHRSLIVKQANPFVQKYPSIAAPTERVLVEAAFYTLAMSRPEVQVFLPKMIGFDGDNHLLAVEDLGQSRDFGFVYQKNATLTQADAKQAATFLRHLHRADFGAAVRAAFPRNLALRRLNHEHLIRYPYLLDHGFDLDTVLPGLQAASLPYKNDAPLRAAVEALGATYLGKGVSLLHGDFYPGSWLRTEAGLRVIDPEFCFFGPPEYDLGVLLAHLRMAQADAATEQAALAAYDAPPSVNLHLAEQFAGMEVLRRIIGLAQLPLELDLAERVALLADARRRVLAPRSGDMA
jgi:5-methylthioribose kinase